ncbi:MAG: hypothetical protein ACTHM1_11920 [Solirubrobacteraceae bacterium]
MPTSIDHHDVPLLREHGVFLTPYDLPDLPRAADVNKVKKQIEKGIRMPSGNVVSYSADMVDALAAPWLQPELMVAQFRSPRFKPTRAGMAATVTGLAAAPLLQTNLFNPRALTKLSIPSSDSEGRVAVPWAPTDRRIDPDCSARMLIDVPTRDELNQRVLESERHIVADQSALAELISREGVQEDLLGVIVNYQTPGLARRLVATTIDGNSRLAIGRQSFRDWINAERDAILEIAQSRRPRLALSRMLNQMRDGLFPLEHDDTVALRHLRKAIESIVNERSTERLIETGYFAVANLFAVPFTLIVAFEPQDDEFTVLDAADTLMRNLHHPSRAATRWDQSAGYAEIRDEIVAKLYNAGDLTLGEALLLGPRFEEAALRYDQPSEPDRRAMAVMELINGDSETGRKARAMFGAATGKPRPSRRERARLIVAAIGEQIDSGNAKLRSDFETAVQDVLDSGRYGTVGNMTVDGGKELDGLVEQAKIELASGKTPENGGEWMMELGLKGAVALAALGHLRRGYAQNTQDAPRPYQVIDNMLSEQFGLEFLGAAISAWRNGERLPEHDPQTREPKADAGDLRPATLGAMFSGEKDMPPEPSARDYCDSLRSVLRDKFMPVYDDLMKLPEVATEGVPPDAVESILAITERVRRRLELKAELYRDFHGDPNGEFADSSDDEE